MSGFEVAGVVLSSLPLIISAIEHYSDLVRTIKSAIRYRTELKNLKHYLDAELTIFLDTLERVLDGLVSARQLEELLKDPATTLWKDVTLNQRLEDRLGRSYSPFAYSVNEMNAIVHEFSNRLDLNDEGKVRWTEKTGLRLTIKRVGFSFRKQEFDDLVARLQKHNRYLEKFTNRSIEFEPSRRARKHFSRSQYLGGYAKSVFDALESSFKCDCSGSDSHTALLGLEPRLSQPIERQEKIKFKIVVSGVLPRNIVPLEKSIIWQEMSLESAKDDTESHSQCQSPMSTLGHTLASTSKPDTPMRPTRKSVRFLEALWTQNPPPSQPSGLATFTSDNSTTDSSSKSNMTSPQSQPIPMYITSMCNTVQTSLVSTHSSCLGYIVDGDRKFFLFPLGRSPTLGKNCWSTISLGQVLQKKAASAPPLTPWDRITLAATVASAVLQLHASPWLKSAWDNEDFLFIQREGERLYKHAFVAKPVSDSGKAAAKSSNTLIFNETLLALATLLVELSLGPLEKLQTLEDRRAGDFADMVTLWRLVENNDIEIVFGPKYQSAVRRCIELAKGSNTLDEQVERDLYEGVVSILEDQAARKHSSP